MGFLFRLCFWLMVAVAIMPADQRPGLPGPVVAADESIGDKLRLVAFSAYNFVTTLGETCDANPRLCEATGQLAATAMDTGHALIAEVQGSLLKPTATIAGDGRVPKFQDRVR